MAGSIVARNRGVLVRASAPLALGVGTGWVVMPYTMRNVGDAVWRVEERWPAVATTHLRVREGIEKGVGMVRRTGARGGEFVNETVTGTREAVEGWVKKGK